MYPSFVLSKVDVPNALGFGVSKTVQKCIKLVSDKQHGQAHEINEAKMIPKGAELI